MDIEIKHCNNIELAKVSICEQKLNIKFAPNGTGKSTIAKAIQRHVENKALNELLPFRYRATNPEDKKPEVFSSTPIDSIMCFNEDYVNQFTFQPEELVSNSFDIFIRTDKYKEAEQEIRTLVQSIKQQFTNNETLESLIANLKELGEAFKITRTSLSKTSTVSKGLSEGNKLEHIPEDLVSFKPFIQSESCVSWIDWQTKGHKDFSGLSDTCPFCSSDATEKKEQIEQVGKQYDKSVIKGLVGIVNVIEKLGDYFSEDARSKLAAITLLKNGLESEHEAFIFTLKKQIDNFVKKLELIKSLSGFHFQDGEKVADKLPDYKLDLQFFSEINATKTQEAIAPINASIDNLINQSGLLQGKINIQRREMKTLVEKHQTDINDFLAYAGYKYKVEIKGDGDKSQLKLLHIDHNEHLSRGNQHLSFGERNAFAIVLFMYECLAKKPSLIILDDPISSFDKNKKFAILEMLFRRDAATCLKSKTVLMLTHDVEPIIDTLKSVRKQFTNQVSASYLHLKNGQITERVIRDNDIKTFSQICQSVMSSASDNIIKLIYLRRYCEIVDDKGDAYQVLSNLFHKRSALIDLRESNAEGDSAIEMSPDKIAIGKSEIAQKIATFDYDSMLSSISDKDKLKTLYQNSANGYEKLQIFRLLDVAINNSVIQKFINETYHIENEFICQLDPAQFDLIPEYVVIECNKIVEGDEPTNPTLETSHG